MAVRNNATTKLILKLVNGVDAAGKEKIVQRSFAHFSDKLTDDQVLDLGTKLGKLQTAVVRTVGREDQTGITAE